MNLFEQLKEWGATPEELAAARIKSAGIRATLRAADAERREATPSSLVAWDGPSQRDGVPIRVIVSGIGSRPSKNTKTGDMAQAWILLRDVAPHIAQKTGADESVCYSCPLRPALKATRPEGLRACYVKTFQGPRATWEANRDNSADLAATVRALQASGRPLRIGAYGDPAAVPMSVWDALRAVAPRHTGYTHQWAENPALRSFLMASADDDTKREQAQGMGFRTFRARSAFAALMPGEISCPASSEAGNRTTCEACNLCDGSLLDDKRRSISIISH